jgi:hypothetical protein
MTDRKEQLEPVTDEKKKYEKPLVVTEEVLERQVLGTDPTPGVCVPH